MVPQVITAIVRAMRSAVRRARALPALRPLVESVDRFWWARTIRRARIVDPDVVRAAGFRSVRAAVRAYVRGGFRTGMILNPLSMEKLIASQLSDVGRVPALYAYLVNDQRRIRTSVNWDAVDYARRYPYSLRDPGGPLGHCWRSSRASGVIDLGPRAIKRVSWRDLIEATIEAYSTAARRPPAVLSPDSSRVLVCEIVDDEPDLAFTLDAVISVAEEDDVSVILAVDGASPENWAASQTLSLWLPRTVTVHSDARVVERLRLRADAILLVRGARAELAAADMRRLLAAAAEGPVAPLWLDTDGTVASAGLVVRGGRYQHLLAGHPREDATALGSEIVTPRPAGDTFARPFTHITASAARTLTDAVVRLPSRPPPQGVVHEEDTALGDTLARAGFVIASQSGGHLELRRPTHRVELESGELVPSLRWAIKIAAPSGRPGEYWGDTHFARGLAAALRRLGQNVVIDAYDARHRRTGYLDDVVLALRGPEPIEPHARSRSLLWIISHPDEITAAQLDGFDEIFAASVPWCDAASSRFGRQIRPLLQCTDPERFHPVGLPRGARRVFVGTARGIARPSVVEPIRAGLPIDVYGPDWTGWIPASSVVARSVPNDQLPAVYESADAVLNDHWPAMQREGFISNRLFDVVASGGRAISDEVAGIEQLFAGAVVTYATIPELLSLLRMDLDEVFPVQSRLREISSYVRRQHSFDSRARVLLDTVLDG